MATVETNLPIVRKRVPLLVAIPATILFFWAMVMLFAPWLMPNDPTEFVSDNAFEPSSATALLGTDYLGRDLFSRLIDAARITLLMGLAATGLAHLVGISLGLLAALEGGWVDTVLSRIVDVILSMPKKIVGLVVVAALGPSALVLICVAAVVYSAGVFRIARSLGNDVRSLDFVKVARMRGESRAWLIFGEILPNVAFPLATDFAVRLGFAILFMSALSFLGLGVQPPAADWGGLVRENLEALSMGSWAPIYPALAIASVTVSLNLLVDAVGGHREAGK